MKIAVLRINVKTEIENRCIKTIFIHTAQGIMYNYDDFALLGC